MMNKCGKSGHPFLVFHHRGKHFIFSLNVNGKMVSVGQGNSKKEAQMDAAKKALEVYEDEKNI